MADTKDPNDPNNPNQVIQQEELDKKQLESDKKTQEHLAKNVKASDRLANTLKSVAISSALNKSVSKGLKVTASTDVIQGLDRAARGVLAGGFIAAADLQKDMKTFISQTASMTSSMYSNVFDTVTDIGMVTGLTQDSITELVTEMAGLGVHVEYSAKDFKKLSQETAKAGELFGLSSSELAKMNGELTRWGTSSEGIVNFYKAAYNEGRKYALSLEDSKQVMSDTLELMSHHGISEEKFQKKIITGLTKVRAMYRGLGIDVSDAISNLKNIDFGDVDQMRVLSNIAISMGKSMDEVVYNARNTVDVLESDRLKAAGKTISANFTVGQFIKDDDMLKAEGNLAWMQQNMAFTAKFVAEQFQMSEPAVKTLTEDFRRHLQDQAKAGVQVADINKEWELYIDKQLKVQKEWNNFSGAWDDFASQMMSIVESIKNVGQVILIKIGKPLLTIFTPIVSLIRQMVAGVAQFVADHDGIITAVGAWMSFFIATVAVNTALFKMGLAFKAVKLARKALFDMEGNFRPQRLLEHLNPAKLVKWYKGALTSTLVYFRSIPGWGNQAAKAVLFLNNRLFGSVKLFRNLTSTMLGFGKSILDNLSQFTLIKKTLDLVSGGFNALVGVGSNVFGKLGSLAMGFGKQLLVALNLGTGGTIALVMGVVAAIALVVKAFSNFRDIMDNNPGVDASEAFKKAWANTFDWLVDTFGGVVSSMVDFIGNLLGINGLSSIFKDWWSSASEGSNSIGETIGKAIGTAIWGIIAAIPKFLLWAFKTAITLLYTAFIEFPIFVAKTLKGLIIGLVVGFFQMLQGMLDKLQELVLRPFKSLGSLIYDHLPKPLKKLVDWLFKKDESKAEAQPKKKESETGVEPIIITPGGGNGIAPRNVEGNGIAPRINVPEASIQYGTTTGAGIPSRGSIPNNAQMLQNDLSGIPQSTVVPPYTKNMMTRNLNPWLSDQLPAGLGDLKSAANTLAAATNVQSSFIIDSAVITVKKAVILKVEEHKSFLETLKDKVKGFFSGILGKIGKLLGLGGEDDVGGGAAAGPAGMGGGGFGTEARGTLEAPVRGGRRIGAWGDKGGPGTDAGKPVGTQPMIGEPGQFVKGGAFKENAPILMAKLMKDYGLSKEQAAGVVGNLAHESAGLKAGIQEGKPLGGGRGGLGWAQWTGSRRRDFEAYLKETGQSATDPNANYGFLKRELDTSYKGAIRAVKGTTSTEDAMRAFEAKYEAAGVKHYGSRMKWANKAMGLDLDNGVYAAKAPGTLDQMPNAAYPQGPGGGTWKEVGNFKARGADKVDPRLREILAEASIRSGMNVSAISGIRPGDKRFHGKGMATDVSITDATGRKLDNYQSAKDFREYEKFAQEARAVQMEKYPELADAFRWGGYFGGGKGKYGALDTMHFDLGGSKSLGMSGGSWEKGLTESQRRLWAGAESVGMGESATQIAEASKSMKEVSSSMADRVYEFNQREKAREAYDNDLTGTVPFPTEASYTPSPQVQQAMANVGMSSFMPTGYGTSGGGYNQYNNYGNPYSQGYGSPNGSYRSPNVGGLGSYGVTGYGGGGYGMPYGYGTPGGTFSRGIFGQVAGAISRGMNVGSMIGHGNMRSPMGIYGILSQMGMGGGILGPIARTAQSVQTGNIPSIIGSIGVLGDILAGQTSTSGVGQPRRTNLSGIPQRMADSSFQAAQARSDEMSYNMSANFPDHGSKFDKMTSLLESDSNVKMQMLNDMKTAKMINPDRQIDDLYRGGIL